MRKSLFCSSAIVGTLFAAPAFAEVGTLSDNVQSSQTQTSGAEAQPTQTFQARTASLEEIVVTAQKRAENVQQVPISITSIDGETLTNVGIFTTVNLSFAAPSLVYTSTGAYAQPYLRGVGSEIAIPNADPSVTTYIDGVVVSANTAIIQNLLGVERVEVLEGPQGTLYGRNATAGAINIYTLTPEDTLDANVSAQVGNFSMRQVTGNVSGGVTEDLAVGFYGGYYSRDSYLTQIGNGPRPDHARGLAGRVKAVWTPSSAVTLTATFEVSDESNPEVGASRNIQPNNLPATLGAPDAVQPPLVINTGPDNRSGFVGTENRTYAAALRQEIDLGFANLLGITGYRNFRSEQGVELDGSPLPILHAYALGRNEQFSQELQLLSPDQSSIQWIVGGFYLHEVVKQDPQQITSQFIFPEPVTGALTLSTVTLNSYALFAQATFPLDFLNPSLSLTLGGRFTHDVKSWSSSGEFTTGPGEGTPIPGTSIIYPDDRESWSNFSPKVSLEYRPNDDLMFYATFARGYKAGAFNMTSPSIPLPPALEPEQLDDFEGGFKGEFFDRRVRLNMAIYHYRRSEIQTSVVAGGSLGVTTLENAGSATATGVQGSLAVALTDDLRFQTSAAWQNSEYTEFENASGFVLSPMGNANVTVDASGNDTPRSPTWVASAQLNYSHDFSDGSAIHFDSAVLYNSGFLWEPTNVLQENAYVVLNGNIGYTLPGGKVKASIFATNITNENYSLGTNFFPVAIGVYDAPPRMYGLRLEWGLN
ncbi:MAG: TonB-dependent receptor [Pseudomonadota bacterium]